MTLLARWRARATASIITANYSCRRWTPRQFRTKTASSAQKGKPLGWMVTLARRRAIDGLRKKQAYARAEERLQRETEQQPDAWVHNATEEEIAVSDTRVLIRRVISILPPAQQQAIELAFFRGMSQREIAANTNTPLGTVKTRLELGLKKIYDGLKELRDEL